jgi:hypothetical protein
MSPMIQPRLAMALTEMPRRKPRPPWQSVFWPAAILFAYGAGILTAMVTP